MNDLIFDQKQSLIEKFAYKFNIEPSKLLTILKATAFAQPKNKDGKIREITNEQMAALLVVADQHDLNPFTKEIYAYPSKNGGIVPVVGVDGWIKKMNEHPQFSGIKLEFSEEMKTMPGAKPCPIWMKSLIYRKDREFPIECIEFLDEVFVQSEYSSPWKSHTKRMLRHKTIIQNIRISFGFSGVYDEDEANIILQSEEKKQTGIKIDLNKKLENMETREIIDIETGEINLGKSPEIDPEEKDSHKETNEEVDFLKELEEVN